MSVDYKACIECGKCTRHCVFLEKYDINLKDYAERIDLAYNCYLCGECKRVCPVDIDGRAISMELRRKSQEEGLNLYKDGYGLLIREKKDYIFKNYKKVDSRRVFFPGCNFPAYYPETTRQLVDILEEKFKISTVFDCCGKPMADLSLAKEEEGVLEGLNKRFEELGIEELILVCPNCYYYLREVLDIKVSMLYEDREIMEEIIEPYEELEGDLFLPCPDKDARLIYKMLEDYIGEASLVELDKIQCCGAGGCAGIKEGELSKNLQKSFKDYDEKVYVYCATCSGMIAKTKDNQEHILVKLMGTGEQAAGAFASLKNRALFSFRK